MFRNYLITALRNIARHKLYSVINIAGLAVGLACVIFIALFVRDELSWDKWVPGSENLYRVESTVDTPGQIAQRNAKIPYPVPQAMLEQIPEVKAITRLVPRTATIMAANRQFLEEITFVDPGFFKVIRLSLIQGDPASVFARPESVVLSQSKARKYFGDEPAMGKRILISGQACDDAGGNCQAVQRPLVVTGIMRDLPHNTQLEGNIFIPNTSAADPMSRDEKSRWMWFVGWGYVLLAPGADPAAVEAKIRGVIDRSFSPQQMMNAKVRGSQVLIPHLTPFRDDHLSTDRYGGLTPAGSWTTIYGFTAIAFLILLIACFNFMNLATARAAMRAREISLRKCMGASRRQLVVQFLIESVLVALVALGFALVLVEILLPAFDAFLGKAIRLNYVDDWKVVMAIVGVAVLSGLVSGSYPALILSAFRPVANLKTSFAARSRPGYLNTCLVILQFAVSIGLGIVMAVVFAQISYSRNMDVGYRKDGIVLIEAGGISPTRRDSFVSALRTNPGVSATAVSDTAPLAGRTLADNVRPPGGGPSEILRIVALSPDFTSLYGVRLLTGRMLSIPRGADQCAKAKACNGLANETAVRQLGMTPQSAIGKTIVIRRTRVTIVGVLSDIHMDGPRSSVAGTIYRYDLEDAPFVSVRVRPGHLKETLGFIDKTWRAIAPTVAIQRRFLSDDFVRQFEADEKQGQVFALFVALAIFIACLGLFGLAAFDTSRRTKEIGIRKTFGARIRDVVLLLLWQFSIPVLLANLIAWPIAWYYLHGWLRGFAYRITLSPIYFLAAGAVALLIAWATILVHAWRVARANPVHALRTE